MLSTASLNCSIFIVSVLITPILCSDWCYDKEKCGNGANWGGLCKKGKKQSPIHFVSARAHVAKQTKLPIKFNEDWCQTNTGIFIKNTGTSIEVSLDKTSLSSDLTFQSPGFRGTYAFSKLNFHWGSEDGEGSEHIVDGEGFDMEIQLLHKRISEIADDDPNASQEFANFGIFVKAKDNIPPNPTIQAILDVVHQVNKIPSTFLKEFEYIPLNLFSLLPKNKMAYRYIGSLTTPNCTEGVVWTVFQHPIEISTEQLDQFRELVNSKEKSLNDNIRKPQKENGRRFAEQRIVVKCRTVTVKLGNYTKEVGEEVEMKGMEPKPKMKAVDAETEGD